MHTRAGCHRVEVRDRARGGVGQLTFHHFLEKEQLAPHSRLLCKMVMEPGTTMGFHTHENEGEFFYILSGVAKIFDGSEEILLYPGDTLFTPSGSSHGIEVEGDETLEYLAIILSAV